jgi:hypothetical protein
MGVPLCGDVPNGRGYITPLDLELANTGYGLDLKRVMDVGEYFQEGECDDVKC